MSTIYTNSSIDNRLIERNGNNSNPLELQKNFLNLLIAQIKNQDPTDPIKNTELTSQLAQINTSTGIERLNNTVIGFSNQINQAQNIQVSSLIGHQVMIPSTEINYTKGNDTKFSMELVNNASSAKIEIVDEKGNILYVKKLENIKPGIYNFTWDGKDLNKNSVKDGQYKILVTAQNQDKNVPAEILISALVHGIITSSGDPIIDLGTAGNITLSKIRAILQ
ncbi:flagellar hook assembly protein FlgD [Buchnera aphidicola (Brachycaudus cardui)]|uniref:Basal-body rod modification protein FlgD n=1 Tax=Buchnera aphidicola (Brachycaudus cardui) TaxID=557993 RepID=A0A4D6Y1K7_9GAMM|nr:flagellar hook assembly protein FlgD [Buchnera aphidicola]QCI20474.1 flagellar hook assembly protein FlgD [Buchnera aphidicola (Brachycaudus cardui)]